MGVFHPLQATLLFEDLVKIRRFVFALNSFNCCTKNVKTSIKSAKKGFVEIHQVLRCSEVRIDLLRVRFVRCVCTQEGDESIVRAVSYRNRIPQTYEGVFKRNRCSAIFRGFFRSDFFCCSSFPEDRM